MPNWCFNDLRVSGPAADLKRFQNQAREFAAPQRTEHEPVPEVFSFQSLLPIPPEIIGANSQGAARDWCLLHWGCRSRAVRNLVAALATLIDKERQAFGIDAKESGEKGYVDFLDGLA